MKEFYPIFLRVSGKRCIVVGGGQVAFRKVKALLECMANIVVISPEIGPELKELASDGQIQAILRNYQRGDLKGALVAIAATGDRHINMMVAEEAQETGSLVNIADDAGNSSFISSSHLSRGDITIAISTSGRSPALARKLRIKLEKEFGKEYASLAQIVNEVREEVKQRGIKVNGDAWQEALDLDVLMRLIRRGEIAIAKCALLDRLLSQ
jgi:siroheme synthase-like protein